MNCSSFRITCSSPCALPDSRAFPACVREFCKLHILYHMIALHNVSRAGTASLCHCVQKHPFIEQTRLKKAKHADNSNSCMSARQTCEQTLLKGRVRH